MAGNNAIQFLRGTASQRASHSEVSLIGQPIYETDTNRLYIGDGRTAINQLQSIGGSTLSFSSSFTQSGSTVSLKGASQTVLGGVKVYEDSSGYLCIDTQ